MLNEDCYETFRKLAPIVWKKEWGISAQVYKGFVKDEWVYHIKNEADQRYGHNVYVLWFRNGEQWEWITPDCIGVSEIPTMKAYASLHYACVGLCLPVESPMQYDQPKLKFATN